LHPQLERYSAPNLAQLTKREPWREYQVTSITDLSSDEFESLREVSKGDAQREIPQLHWERLVGLGYAMRRLGELDVTAAGIRRLAAGIS